MVPDASALGLRNPAGTLPSQIWLGHSMVFPRDEEAVVHLRGAGSSGLLTIDIRSSGDYSLPKRRHGQYAAVGFGQKGRGSVDVSQDGSQSGIAGVHCFAE